MNTRTIRRLFLQRHRRYEKRFAKLFNKAIRGQWLYASRELDTEQLPTVELERAYQTMYLYIMQEEGVITWNLYMPDDRIKSKDITDVIAQVFRPENASQMSRFWQQLMNTYLDTYTVSRQLEISKTTARQIVAHIEGLRADGVPVSDIRRSLEKESRKQQIRANTIARTEATNAMNKSQILALNSSSREWEKSWDAIRDDRTRDAHFSTDPDLWIDLNEPFNVGGELLGYPGDITLGATAGNLINCRCSLRFREKGQRYGFRRTRTT